MDCLPLPKTTTLLSYAILLWLLASPAGQAAEPIWQSGFETGFPGREWLDLDNGSFLSSDRASTERGAAWRIINRESGEPVYSGNHAYKGWITRFSDQSHRAYPVIHADIPTPVVNTFMAYLDVDYDQMSAKDWIHFGTWGNHDPETRTGQWALHTMAVRNRKLEFAHVTPFHGEYLGTAAPPDFPLRRWVRFSLYIHYAGDDGMIQVWQDGVPTLRARVSQLADHPGTRLRTAHWGIYASGSIGQGIQYNDDIRICQLSKPLTEFTSEPICPEANPGLIR